MSNLNLRFLSILLLAPVVISIVYFNGNYFIILLLFIFVLSFYEIWKLSILKYKLFLYILLSIFIYSAYDLRNLNSEGGYLFLIIAITWLSDLGGYIFGKVFKGKKINVISPNKTYIGFFGSIIFSLLIIPTIPYFNIEINDSIFFKFFFIMFSSIFVILGDLFFSYIKRMNGIKDYSKIIPGHGGILDRIDGLIFIVIAYQIYFVII